MLKFSENQYFQGRGTVIPEPSPGEVLFCMKRGRFRGNRPRGEVLPNTDCPAEEVNMHPAGVHPAMNMWAPG